MSKERRKTEEVDGTWASAVIFITRLGLKAEGNKGRLEMPQIRLCGLDSWKKQPRRGWSGSFDVEGACVDRRNELSLQLLSRAADPLWAASA